MKPGSICHAFKAHFGALNLPFQKAIFFFLFAALFAFFSQGQVSRAYAATYYVSQTDGNDSYDGLAQSHTVGSTGPFKTMAKLSGFGFSAGDQVMLKKGDTWRETWYVNTGGTSGNPITYGSYGTDSSKPRITGTEVLTGWTVHSGNVYKANFANSIDIYLLLEDSTMATPVGSLVAVNGVGKFWFDDPNNVVYYWATDGADPDTHSMEIGARYDVVSCDDRTDITFSGLQIDGAGGQYGRGFGLKPTWNTPSAITLQDMRITNNYYAGVWLSYATNFTPISNFKVYSSEIDHNGVFGMRIEGQSASYRISGFRLDGSHVHHNGLDSTSIGQIGVWLDHTSSPIITGSTLNDNQGYLDWSDNLYTVDTKNALVEKNIFYNGYKSNAHFDVDSNGFIFRYNISYGAGWNGVWVEEHLRANGVSYIYNNVLYNNLHGFVFGPGGTAFVVSGVVVRNNIIAYNTRASDDLNNTNDDNDVDYNTYYTTGSAQGEFRYGGAFVDFATWKTDTGWDAHSTFAEPSFLNRTTFDFHLTSSSPAINAGTDVGLTSDFTGSTVPQGDAPDNGAYEFLLSSTASSLAQYKSDGSTSISFGAYQNQSSVTLAFAMSSTNASDSLTPQIEIREVGTSFTDSVTNTGDSVASVGNTVIGTVTITGLTDGKSYHWQARVSNPAGQSAWVTTGQATDFKIDTSGTTIPTLSSPTGYSQDTTKPTFIFKKATDSGSGLWSYSVHLDPGKNRSFSTSGIPVAGNGSGSFVWKDDSVVKVTFVNENDSDSTNDEIQVYFKGLDNTGLTQGQHSWTVTTYDGTGNTSTASTSFYLDQTSPSIAELAIANVSTVYPEVNYNLGRSSRMLSFSGLALDTYQGSTVTNSNGTSDTFATVSSGPQTLTLTLQKLKDGQRAFSPTAEYIDYLSKDFSVSDLRENVADTKSARFFITTPYPVGDGFYRVKLSLKDEAANTYEQPPFYLTVNNQNNSASSNPVKTIQKLITGSLDTEITGQEAIPVQSNAEQTQVKEHGYTVKIKVVDDNNHPVKGATVRIHSTVQETLSDEQGIAIFTGVAPGDHKIFIAYAGFEGEQDVRLSGEIQEFRFDITVKPQHPVFSPLIITIVGVVIVAMGLVTIKAKRR